MSPIIMGQPSQVKWSFKTGQF